MSVRDIAIFGASGFGREVAMLIDHINRERSEWNLIGFFDDNDGLGPMVNDLPIKGGLKELNAWPTALCVVFALGFPKIKKSVIGKVINANLSFPTLIHPSVIMGDRKYVSIGEGSIICAGSILTTNIKIGPYVTINLACTVGHDTEIGAYSSLMPTCNISGEVHIGSSSFWGTGAKIINQRNVGQYTTIGAGAVVIQDIPDNATAVGVPAKIVKYCSPA